MAYIAQIVTESEYAIRSAGDQFLRFGYNLGQQWKVVDLRIMKHFTYWKCSEVWLTCDRSALESAQQAIKDIMANGTNVWSDPTDIGRVSIYDNI